MEKYGVETTLTKSAGESTDHRCPDCDSKLLKKGSVPRCPRCGTRPFEVKDDSKAPSPHKG